ncbi:MAG: twin-arginine translocase TatA/TatE family subunit, partial [Bacteroidales bacterium]
MISGGEIFLVLLFVLILFGADKIPDLAKGLGKGVREFKKASEEIQREIAATDGGILSDVRKDLNEIKSNLTDTLDSEAVNPASDLADALNEAGSDVPQYGAGAVIAGVNTGYDTPSSNESTPQSDTLQPESSSLLTGQPEGGALSDKAEMAQ